MAFDFSEFAEKWESPVVARAEIGRFSGGLLSPGRVANLDSQGLGPERVRIGKKIVYPVGSLVIWMQGRVQAVDTKSPPVNRNHQVK